MTAEDWAIIFALISVVCTVVGYGGEFVLYLIG